MTATIKLSPSQKLAQKLAARNSKIVDDACAKVQVKIDALKSQINALEDEQRIMRATVPAFDAPQAA